MTSKALTPSSSHVQVMSQDDSHATFYATVVNAAITVCGVGGGVLADAVWGKLKVQVVTSWVWMAGVVALLASVLLGRHTYGGGGDANSETGPPPSFGTAALAAAGLALLSVGYGAQQPSQTGFVGDQTPPTLPARTRMPPPAPSQVMKQSLRLLCCSQPPRQLATGGVELRCSTRGSTFGRTRGQCSVKRSAPSSDSTSLSRPCLPPAWHVKWCLWQR